MNNMRMNQQLKLEARNNKVSHFNQARPAG